jgi:hypothetical protein
MEHTFSLKTATSASRLEVLSFWLLSLTKTSDTGNYYPKHYYSVVVPGPVKQKVFSPPGGKLFQRMKYFFKKHSFFT